MLLHRSVIFALSTVKASALSAWVFLSLLLVAAVGRVISLLHGWLRVFLIVTFFVLIIRLFVVLIVEEAKLCCLRLRCLLRI